MKTNRNASVKAPAYRIIAADLRRLLMLADIAADHGNLARAAWHVVSGLRELAPDLHELRKAARP